MAVSEAQLILGLKEGALWGDVVKVGPAARAPVRSLAFTGREQGLLREAHVQRISSVARTVLAQHASILL